MHLEYVDILALTDDDPVWWDSNGVPRFAEFTPYLCPNIYADWVVLLLIGCQYCGERFFVEMHGMEYHNSLGNPRDLHYGDPPRHDCVGDTMNCDDIEVREVWIRSDAMIGWKRHDEMEGMIDEEAPNDQDATN